MTKNCKAQLIGRQIFLLLKFSLTLGGNLLTGSKLNVGWQSSMPSAFDFLHTGRRFCCVQLYKYRAFTIEVWSDCKHCSCLDMNWAIFNLLFRNFNLDGPDFNWKQNPQIVITTGWRWARIRFILFDAYEIPIKISACRLDSVFLNVLRCKSLLFLMKLFCS